MDKAEILLVVNSILLTFLTVMFAIIGYFLKDLHKDFKQMIDRVNNLYQEHNKHVTISERFDSGINEKVNFLEKEVTRLVSRCDRLESAKS
jgi:hypothetical protein